MNNRTAIENVVAFRQCLWRSKRIQKFLNNDLKKLNLPNLTYEQKQKVREVWKGIRVDYRWFAFFNRFNEEWREWTPLYMPSNLYYSIVDMHYTDYKKCRTIEDKNLNSLFFYDVKQPKTIARMTGGILLDGDFNRLAPEELLKKITPNQSYLIKPSIESGGGKSIMVYKGGEVDKFDGFIGAIPTYQNCVVQEFASQHKQLASLHPSSLNTIRIMTFFHNGEPQAISTIIRMGAGGGKIDNASAGGIFVGVDQHGNLKNIAYNDYGDVFKQHPTTGEHYEEHHVPGYDKLLLLAETLHDRFLNFTRLISWDFAIDAEGDPILIEMNATHGGISFHQMCNGPLFGDMTKEVIAEVFNKRNRLLSRII